MRVYSQHNKRTTTTDRTRIGIPQYNNIKLDSGPLLTLSVTTVTSHQRGGVTPFDLLFQLNTASTRETSSKSTQWNFN